MCVSSVSRYQNHPCSCNQHTKDVRKLKRLRFGLVFGRAAQSITGKRVWFGEPLLSATADEVRRLIAKAKEWAVLKKQRQSPENTATTDPPVDVRPPDEPTPPVADAAGNPGAPGRDYCAAVRGIRNDDQGGPLHPPGLRMADALTEVRASIPRNLDAKKGGSPSRNSTA